MARLIVGVFDVGRYNDNTKTACLQRQSVGKQVCFGAANRLTNLRTPAVVNFRIAMSLAFFRIRATIMASGFSV
jgi:hypothetical protein